MLLPERGALQYMLNISCYIPVMSSINSDYSMMQNNNSYPMREWHVEHMKKTVLKFVTGLPYDASSWQKRQHKKYNKISNILKGINYDIKHGVTREEVLSFMDEVISSSSFSDVRKVEGSAARLREVKEHFVPLQAKTYQWIK